MGATKPRPRANGGSSVARRRSSMLRPLFAVLAKISGVGAATLALVVFLCKPSGFKSETFNVKVTQIREQRTQQLPQSACPSWRAVAGHPRTLGNGERSPLRDLPSCAFDVVPVTADVYRTARKFMKTFQKFDRSEGLRHRSVSATPVSNCVLIWGFPHIRCTILGIP